MRSGREVELEGTLKLRIPIRGYEGKALVSDAMQKRVTNPYKGL